MADENSNYDTYWIRAVQTSSNALHMNVEDGKFHNLLIAIPDTTVADGDNQNDFESIMSTLGFSFASVA